MKNRVWVALNKVSRIFVLIAGALFLTGSCEYREAIIEIKPSIGDYSVFSESQFLHLSATNTGDLDARTVSCRADLYLNEELYGSKSVGFGRVGAGETEEQTVSFHVPLETMNQASGLSVGIEDLDIEVDRPSIGCYGDGILK